MSERWKHIDTFPDDPEKWPDEILVWNDCNGPHYIWDSAEMIGLKFDGCWVAWRECKGPSDEEAAKLIAKHKKEYPWRFEPRQNPLPHGPLERG